MSLQEGLQVDLETETDVQPADTGARHHGNNGYCAVIGHQSFADLKAPRVKAVGAFWGPAQVVVPFMCLKTMSKVTFRELP